MAYYEAPFRHIPEDADIHLLHTLQGVIGQLRISSHQLDIEIDRCAHKPIEERISHLCRQGVD